jgi:hypothetical protein
MSTGQCIMTVESRPTKNAKTKPAMTAEVICSGENSESLSAAAALSLWERAGVRAVAT